MSKYPAKIGIFGHSVTVGNSFGETVNRRVVGSSPTGGAKKSLKTLVFKDFFILWGRIDPVEHANWMGKYHIVFTYKYRRKMIYNQYKMDLRDIIKQLRNYKGVEILKGHLMPDYVHMPISIPPKLSVSSFMGYLKGKSALMMFDRQANLKYKFGNRHFWAVGYVSTVGLNEDIIKNIYKSKRKQILCRTNSV